MQQNTNIFIVDDNKEVVNSLSYLVESVGYTPRPFTNAKQFLEEYKEQEPGCLVLDVRMPGLSGLELQERLNELHINVPIIFTTSYADVPMAVRAMKSGATDFLCKPVNCQVLIEAINKALDKDKETRSRQQKYLDIMKLVERLTPREKEVMQLVVKGNLTRMIAEQLKISAKTVDLHRARVMDKMEAKTVAELVNKVSQLDEV